MDRYPGLKICLAHGGGYVPYALDRLDKGWEVWAGSRGRSKDKPSTYVDRFYYDTVVTPPATCGSCSTWWGSTGSSSGPTGPRRCGRRRGRPARDEAELLEEPSATTCCGARPRALFDAGVGRMGRRPSRRCSSCSRSWTSAARALEEFADVEVHESERMIGRAALLAGVRDCDYVWMLGDTPIDAEVMDAAPELKGIATMALFPNVVDVEAATRAQAAGDRRPARDHEDDLRPDAARTSSASPGGSSRPIGSSASGRFHQEQSTTFLTHELAGKVVGMIGVGEIGTEIVKRLRAFEMDVIYTKRNRLPEDAERELGRRPGRRTGTSCCASPTSWSLMATYNETTHKLIGAREFDLMKPSAFFVNTARGRIVDEPALIEALREGKIAGAGLDVYWQEPPVGEPAPSPELFEFPT